MPTDVLTRDDFIVLNIIPQTGHKHAGRRKELFFVLSRLLRFFTMWNCQTPKWE
jgi:hypothetical protein